jgi:predicted Zn finger-like uncharacterized protein
VNALCPVCRTVFRVDPAKIPFGGVRTRCSSCGAIFEINIEDTHPALSDSPAVHGQRAIVPRAGPFVPTPPGSASVRGRLEPGASTHGAGRNPTPPGAPGVPTPLTNPRMATPPASSRIATPTASSRTATPPAAPRVTPTSAGSPTPPATAGTPTPAGGGTIQPAAAPAAPALERRRTPNPYRTHDPDVRARRLARALVSDMIAYRPEKRAEGLRNGTLKQLFREEIKKSYEEYVEQVGFELAESTMHFQDALNELLAGGRRVF